MSSTISAKGLGTDHPVLEISLLGDCVTIDWVAE